MSMTFDMDTYFREEVEIKLPRIEIFLLVMSLCFAFENKKMKNSWMWVMLQPLGKKIVDHLRIKGILPMDDNVILEWTKRGFL